MWTVEHLLRSPDTVGNHAFSPSTTRGWPWKAVPLVEERCPRITSAVANDAGTWLAAGHTLGGSPQPDQFPTGASYTISQLAAGMTMSAVSTGRDSLL